MQTSFVINAQTKGSFAGRTLLLDTNILLDAYRLPSEFYDLAKEFGDLDCDFTTTRTITVEFLGGTSDEKDLEVKAGFLEATFGKDLKNIPLPIDRELPRLEDILIFSRQANKFTLADFELYCTLQKYKKKVALISRNHRDFSTRLANRISFITLLGKSEIHTYGVYTLV